MHECVGKLSHFNFKNIYQISLIRSLGANFSDFFYRNSYIFIHKNAFENGIFEMAAILSWPQCVNQCLIKNFVGT